MPTLEQCTAPTGHMAAQLNVTFCDMSCSWLTRRVPAVRGGDLGWWPGDRCRPERDIVRGLIGMRVLWLPVR